MHKLYKMWRYYLTSVLMEKRKVETAEDSLGRAAWMSAISPCCVPFFYPSFTTGLIHDKCRAIVGPRGINYAGDTHNILRAVASGMLR
jgi:hypothetical protein